MDVAIDDLKHLIKRHYRNNFTPDFTAVALIVFGQIFTRGAQPRPRHSEELADPLIRSDHDLQNYIARTLVAKLIRIKRHRFDVDSFPAMLMKSTTYRIFESTLCAHIHVVTGNNASKRTPQHHIFEVLRVRNDPLGHATPPRLSKS